jgi:hypothetical protein
MSCDPWLDSVFAIYFGFFGLTLFDLALFGFAYLVWFISLSLFDLAYCIWFSLFGLALFGLASLVLLI